jgi:Cu/Ag efflux protein CusF
MCIVAMFALTSVLGWSQDGQASPALQEPGSEQAGPRHRGPGVAGTITAIDDSKITIKTSDGATVQVTTTEGTQFRKNREPAKLSDFKVGDDIFVAGDLKDGVVQARMVGSRPAGGPGPEFREALGKHFIAGEVKAINGTQITVLRPDGVSQKITVDENTSFRKDQESITLADIKVGDHVFGRGEVKKDVFIPADLNVGEPSFMGPPPDGKPGPQ